MERIQTSSGVRLRPVVIHRRDLDDIIQRATSVGGPAKVVVGEYAVESLDEAQREFGNTVEVLEIASGDFRVEFSPTATYLHGRTADSKALVLEIAEKLRPKQRLGAPWWSPLLGGACIGTALGGVMADRTLSATLLSVLIVGIALTTTLFPWWLKQRLILVREHEDQPWYRKYQGDIIRGTVTGLIGGGVGYALRMFQGH